MDIVVEIAGGPLGGWTLASDATWPGAASLYRRLEGATGGWSLGAWVGTRLVDRRWDGPSGRYIVVSADDVGPIRLVGLAFVVGAAREPKAIVPGTALTERSLRARGAGA